MPQTEKVNTLSQDVNQLSEQVINNFYTQNRRNAKISGSIAFISACLGIGTGLYAWYKPNQSPLMPMLSTFFFGGATTSGIAAWHFYKMSKSLNANQ